MLLYKATSKAHTRSSRASPYTTTTKTTKTTAANQASASMLLRRQCSFGVATTLRRVADLHENHERVIAQGGTARVTIKLEQWNTVQTRSRARQLAAAAAAGRRP